MAKKPHYKKHDWDKYKEEYIYSNLSLPDLVRKYGVSLSQLGKVAKKGNWVELKKIKKEEIAKEVEKKSTENEIDRRVAINEEHLELFKQGLNLVKSILKEYEDYQNKIKNGETDVPLNPANLEKIFNCIDKGQKGQRLALGLDKKEEAEEKAPEIRYINNLDISKI